MHGGRVTIVLESTVALHLGLSLTGTPQKLRESATMAEITNYVGWDTYVSSLAMSWLL